MFSSFFSTFTDVVSGVCNLSGNRTSRRRNQRKNVAAGVRTESLEVKSYPTATLAASVVGAAAGQASLVADAKTEAQGSFAPVAGSQFGLQAAASSTVATGNETSGSYNMATRRILSVVTILNASPQTMTYAIQWPGQAAQTVVLLPGQARVHFSADPRQQNLAPKVVFDGSAAPGFQPAIGVLHSKFYVQSTDEVCTFDGGKRAVTTGWRTPSTQDGMVHAYQTNASRTGFAMQMYNSMNTSRRADVLRYVGGVTGRYEVLGSFTNGPRYGVAGTYNCIAWTVGNVGQWVWNPQWQTGNATSMSAMYQSLGYSRTSAGNTGLQLGFQKVAVYATFGARGGISITHGALQMSDGTWTSKMGQTPLVRHETANSVAGNQGVYGSVVAVFVRRTTYGWGNYAGAFSSNAMTAALQNAARKITLSVAKTLIASQTTPSSSKSPWASQPATNQISQVVRSEFQSTVRELQHPSAVASAPKVMPVSRSVASSDSETIAIDALMSDVGGLLGSLLA